MNQRLRGVIGVAVCMSLPVVALARPNENRREEEATKHEEASRRHEVARDEHDPRRRGDLPPKGEVPPPPRAEGQPVPGAMPNNAEANRLSRTAEHFKAQLAQERAQRKAARQDPKTWNDSRLQRAQTRRSDIAQTWGPVANSQQAKAELSTHADRMARLHRALDIAEEKNDAATVARVNEMLSREIDRDARAMGDLQARGGAQ